MRTGVTLAASRFDASTYWQERLGESPSLSTTGTRPFGEDYQRYLYRLKEVALRRLLRPCRDRLVGGCVLNVGCGWGHFEPFFANLGADRVTGVDFVESAITTLQARRPQFEYLTVDMTQPLPASLANRSFDVVTAMDVLYHIVDEDAFRVAVNNLCSLCRPGGLLIWTDAPHRPHDPEHPHCRYRAWSAYQDLFADHGLEFRSSAPMYGLFDAYWPWSERAADHPRLFYPLMYAWDRLIARFGWRRTANHLAIARREGEPRRETPA